MNEKIKNFNAGAFFRQYGIDFLVVLFGLVYILVEVLRIDETGKTVNEILFNGAKALVGGFIITYSLGLKGLMDGEKNPQFQNTMNEYGKIIEKITPHIDKLPDFCEKKNASTVRIMQGHELIKAGLSYDAWVKGEIVPKTKAQMKAVERAENVRPKLFHAEELTSDIDNTDIAKGLGQTKQQYLTITTAKGFPMSIAISVVIGLYSFNLIDNFSWANLIWAALQVCGFFASGGIKYLQRYMWINDQYKARIIRKTNLLYEFFAGVEKGEVIDNGNVQ